MTKLNRFRAVGLCVAVACTVGIGSATAASAAAPEYGRCVKKATKTLPGYSDSKCTKAATSEKNSKYEWLPGFTKQKFTSVGGAAVLTTVGGAGVECSAETSGGEFAPAGNNKEERGVVVKFTGCKSLGAPCTTPGAASGEIVTNELDGLVGWEVKARKKTAVELFPAPAVKSGLFVEFNCQGLVVKVRGHVLVPIKNDVMKTTETLKFVASKGKQKPEKWEESAEPAILEASFKGGPFEQAGQLITTTLTSEEPLELNAVV